MAPTKRLGFTLDHTANYTQGHLPMWPDKFANVSGTSWVGRVGRDRATALAIAEKHHIRNEAIRHAKLTRTEVQLPEPPVRISLARQQQRQLDEIDRRAGSLGDEIFTKRLSLKVHDFEKDGILGLMQRQEMRTLLRGMKPDEREAAMKRHSFRLAALETAPELSGLQTSLHAELKEETLRAMYPSEMADLDAAAEAVDILQETASVTRKAVDAELKAAGSTVDEPTPPPEFAPSWA